MKEMKEMKRRVTCDECHKLVKLKIKCTWCDMWLCPKCSLLYKHDAMFDKRHFEVWDKEYKSSSNFDPVLDKLMEEERVKDPHEWIDWTERGNYTNSVLLHDLELELEEVNMR